MSTIEWFILILVSVSGGSLVLEVLENIEINVWLSRGIGCLVSVIIGLIIANFFLKRSISKQNKN